MSAPGRPKGEHRKAQPAAAPANGALGVQAVIFDLDNCLCDATEVGEALFAPAFAAIRAANRGHVDDTTLQQALADCWHTAFDAVAQRHGFSAEMLRAGHAAFGSLEVPGTLHGYPDLPVVRTLPLARYLVTSGYRRLQQSKIRALGIGSWFDQVIIDAVDEPDHPGKRRIFQAILDARQWQPAEVVVVGDNPLSELAAGRELGMTTVQLLRPGVQRTDAVDHHIERLEQLRSLLHGRA